MYGKLTQKKKFVLFFSYHMGYCTNAKLKHLLNERTFYMSWWKSTIEEVSKWLGPRFYKWFKDGQKTSHGLPLVITSNHDLGRAEDFV